jgi:arabinan endo-1,5-alpha-L-arabinosidase
MESRGGLRLSAYAGACASAIPPASSRSFAVIALWLAGCSGVPDIVARGDLPGGVHDPDNPPTVVTLSGDLAVHDPSIIQASGSYYVFHSGPGILVKVSNDLMAFRAVGSVFDERPAWVAESVPDATDLWSPDIAFFGDAYQLYYAASSFGSDRSCIGHATASALDETPSFLDQGAIICSNVETNDDDWNAIDPSLIVTRDETPWLAFGSFGAGIQLVRLTAGGRRADDAMYLLASRPDQGDALQASALIERGGYYYLFVSFDACCRGSESTHRLMVGRSRNITGPYLDRDQVPMLDGGGSLVLESGARFRGPGSNDVLFDGSRVYNAYHAYDADNEGRATLRIAEMVFDRAGWPISGGP